MEHRRVCFCMLSLLPLVQISKLSQANSLLFSKVCCRTPRGVRGLKLKRDVFHDAYARRTPRGVRGLKSGADGAPGLYQRQSHPSRGAWIEMTEFERDNSHHQSRTPRGVRGLK